MRRPAAAVVTPVAGSNGGAGLVLVLLTVGGLLLVTRRRQALTAVVWAGASIAMSMQPACSCNKSEDKACEVAADCGSDFCPAGQLPFCLDNTCVCDNDIPIGKIGPYSQVAAGADGSVWVSAYAQTYGDLAVAKVTSVGRIADDSWEFVDGVPTGPVVVPGSMIRGGISATGPDVGMYTSIKVAPDGTPMVTYFDKDTGSLKFAAKVAGVWQSHIVDMGTGQLTATSGTVAGMYTSLTLRTDNGHPGVAYLAHVVDAAGEHAEVRYASAQVAVPMSAGDWQTWTVDTAPVPADPTNVFPLPEGLGLFIDSARMADQSPVVVYYDRSAGELKMSTFDTTTGEFGTPVLLAGSNGVDAGWTPSIAVDAMGVVNVAYVDATTNALNYIDSATLATSVIDNGYRIVGVTVDGLPKPTYDFVGANAGLIFPNGGAAEVAYQDATTQELLLAQRKPDGTWPHISVAGAANPWNGAYGFFASAATTSANQVVLSTWVIDQPTSDNWVEVFEPSVAIQ